MEYEALESACAAANKKLNFFKFRIRYFVYASMAGALCTIGMALAGSVAAGFYATDGLREIYSLIMGILFTFTLTMIVVAGAELFTGNVMIMTVAFMQKRILLMQGLVLLLVCYLANVIGAAVMGLIVWQTGLLEGRAGDMIVMVSTGKATLSFKYGFFRGILCNMMICLGTWCALKLKSETAKLICIFWVIVCFVATGYEHSIANAGIFTMAILAKAAFPVTPFDVFRNMLSSTIGNFVGGMVFVGLFYWFTGRDTQKA
jgi:nitrite transporter NirC